MSFPDKLYKLDSSGNLRTWQIQVAASNAEHTAAYIKVEHGVENGKLQTDTETITEGKNLGKVNATTAYLQALAEAHSKWTKQVEQKGYVADRERALRGENDVPGPTPMLAHPLVDRDGKIKKNNLKKLKWPLAIQPKLDGMRCLAVVDNGKVNLWTRRGKPITAVPHIEEEIARFFPEGFWVLDGELYNHDLKEDFETLISLSRTKNKIDQEKVMQYHIYDAIMPGEFLERFDNVVGQTATKAIEIGSPNHLRLVPTTVVSDLAEAKGYLEEYLEAGYEGLMLRNLDASYDNEVTRSYNLQKYKLFQEEEFPIIGVKEGRGRMKGMAIFICETTEGKPFDVKLEGKLENLRQYWEDETTWQGKQLTVCFQKYSNKNNVPIILTGKAVRDYE